MTWGSVKNSGEACVFCIVVIGETSPLVEVRCKMRKSPQSFWHSLKSFQLQSQFQFQFQNKQVKNICLFFTGLHFQAYIPNLLIFTASWDNMRTFRYNQKCHQFKDFWESSYVMALFLGPESSHKSPNCIHKSPDSPNSGHAIHYGLIGGYPPITA